MDGGGGGGGRDIDVMAAAKPNFILCSFVDCFYATNLCFIYKCFISSLFAS